MVKIDTVPSTMLETSASVPFRLIEMPAAPLPASSVAMTRGGLALRSMTETWLLGTCLVGSFGSILFDAVTSARPSSGVMATLSGGPATAAGACTSATTRGGVVLRSMIEMVSGAGFGSTFTTPLSSITLLSFADTAIWACAREARVRPATAPAATSERETFMAHLRGEGCVWLG
jgi:hypothetical protein